MKHTLVLPTSILWAALLLSGNAASPIKESANMQTSVVMDLNLPKTVDLESFWTAQLDDNGNDDIESVSFGTAPRNGSFHYSNNLPPTSYQDNDKDMHLVMLPSNETAACNDGTNAGYYIRRRAKSKKWLVYLEGGWYCFDKMSCAKRWADMHSLMSSRDWKSKRTPDDGLNGILSPRKRRNRLFYDANVVLIPYCSSDGWTGLNYGRTGGFKFLGSAILMEVIRQLLLREGLRAARRLYLSGSSAGGVGVYMNIDKIADYMAVHASNCKVKGIADSGWFLDNKPYKPVLCLNYYQCAPTEGIRKGITLWQGQVPEICRRQFALDEQWNCYFAHRMFTYLKTPVFVINYLYDEAQIAIDNVGHPNTVDQWKFIRDVGNETGDSLEAAGVRGMFAPACLSHVLINTHGWYKLEVQGQSLQDTIECWDFEDWDYNDLMDYSLQLLGDEASDGGRSGARVADEMQNDQPTRSRTAAPHRNSLRVRQRPSKSPPPNRKRPHQRRHQANQPVAKQRSQRRRMQSDQAIASDGDKRKRSLLDIAAARPARAHSPAGNGSLWTLLLQQPRVAQVASSDAYRGLAGGTIAAMQDLAKQKVESLQRTCARRVRDECHLPQCNDQCPKLRSPFTGRTIHFVDILMKAGLVNEQSVQLTGLTLHQLRTLRPSELAERLPYRQSID